MTTSPQTQEGGLRGRGNQGSNHPGLSHRPARLTPSSLLQVTSLSEVLSDRLVVTTRSPCRQGTRWGQLTWEDTD